MKTMYIQCNMGAAGDMLTAALLELVDDKQDFLEKLNGAGIPDVYVEARKVTRCGIGGTHVHVFVNGVEEEPAQDSGHEQEHNHAHEHEHDHDHDHPHMHGHATHSGHHHTIHDIEHIVQKHLKVEESVKRDILEVFQSIAEAESAVHGKQMEQIHFHEVGTMDAVADITAVCMLMHEIAPEKVIVSPIHVGSGNVKCAHGILPVPAPATAHLLQGIPYYSGNVRGELCTPTGAALLRYFADEFGEMPVMCTEKIGYGMGTKEFAQANCVRTFLGETLGSADYINELCCNLDDMTAEEIGFAMDRLYEAGAAEVFTVPAGTKKNRPAVVLHVLCKDEVREAMIQTLFTHTSTIGIRQSRQSRCVLERTIVREDTPFGTVRRKDCTGYGVKKSKYEFDDLSRIAAVQGLSLSQVRSELEKNKNH